MADGPRKECRDCGDKFVSSKLQSDGHTHGVRVCRSCYIEQCEHRDTSRTPQSGKVYCENCGKVVEDGKELKSLRAW